MISSETNSISLHWPIPSFLCKMNYPEKIFEASGLLFQLSSGLALGQIPWLCKTLYQLI